MINYIDGVIVDTLKKDIKTQLSLYKGDADKDLEYIPAFLKVIEYYLPYADYQEYAAEINKQLEEQLKNET